MSKRQEEGQSEQHNIWRDVLTCTLGPGGKRRSWWSCASLAWPCEQHPDLILHIRVQMPELVVGRIHDVGLGPGARGSAVFHFLQNDGTVPNNGVGIWLNPQVGGPHRQQFWGSDRRGRLCKKASKPRNFSLSLRSRSKHVKKSGQTLNKTIERTVEMAGKGACANHTLRWIQRTHMVEGKMTPKSCP